MTRSRRTFSPEEKAATVKRYLVDKTPVSNLCDELGLQPTQVYQWQKQLLENAHLAFTNTTRPMQKERAKDKEIEALKAKIQLKNEVVAELLQEHVQLKKARGES